MLYTKRNLRVIVALATVLGGVTEGNAGATARATRQPAVEITAQAPSTSPRSDMMSQLFGSLLTGDLSSLKLSEFGAAAPLMLAGVKVAKSILSQDTAVIKAMWTHLKKVSYGHSQISIPLDGDGSEFFAITLDEGGLGDPALPFRPARFAILDKGGSRAKTGMLAEVAGIGAALFGGGTAQGRADAYGASTTALGAGLSIATEGIPVAGVFALKLGLLLKDACYEYMLAPQTARLDGVAAVTKLIDIALLSLRFARSYTGSFGRNFRQWCPANIQAGLKVFSRAVITLLKRTLPASVSESLVVQDELFFTAIASLFDMMFGQKAIRFSDDGAVLESGASVFVLTDAEGAGEKIATFLQSVGAVRLAAIEEAVHFGEGTIGFAEMLRIMRDDFVAGKRITGIDEAAHTAFIDGVSTYDSGKLWANNDVYVDQGRVLADAPQKGFALGEFLAGGDSNTVAYTGKKLFYATKRLSSFDVLKLVAVIGVGFVYEYLKEIGQNPVAKERFIQKQRDQQWLDAYLKTDAGALSLARTSIPGFGVTVETGAADDSEERFESAVEKRATDLKKWYSKRVINAYENNNVIFEAILEARKNIEVSPAGKQASSAEELVAAVNTIAEALPGAYDVLIKMISAEGQYVEQAQLHYALEMPFVDEPTESEAAGATQRAKLTIAARIAEIKNKVTTAVSTGSSSATPAGSSEASGASSATPAGSSEASGLAALTLDDINLLLDTAYAHLKSTKVTDSTSPEALFMAFRARAAELRSLLATLKARKERAFLEKAAPDVVKVREHLTFFDSLAQHASGMFASIQAAVREGGDDSSDAARACKKRFAKLWAYPLVNRIAPLILGKLA